MSLAERLAVSVAAGALAVSAGCYSQREVPFFRVESMAYVCQTDEVMIGAEPVVGDLSERVYGKDVGKKGYLPFIVHIENNGADAIKIRKGSIQFCDGEENNYRLSSGLEIAEDFKTSGLFSTLTPGCAKGIIWAAVTKSNQDRRFDYYEKELPPTVEVFGESRAYGIVVLKNGKVKKPLERNKNGTFRAVVEKEGNLSEIKSGEQNE